jgi:ABC-2 type transport system permease protein
LPSPSAASGRWLRRKEFGELALSPAFALMLVLVGLLVGHEFISAVQTYAEMSGSNGGPAALAQGMNPLDGILVPTFGAYDIAAMLLLPFVVIRLFSAERATGAWTLLVQSPATIPSMVATKALALGVAWLIALVPGLTAVALWLAYGGHVYAPELMALVFGHLLRAALTVAIAAAAAAVTRQAASAAIITLGVTIGSWALEFTAATRGGAWATVAAFTPSSALRTFEQGLVRADVVAVMIISCFAGLAVAAIWLVPGAALRARWARSIRAVLVCVVAAAVASRAHSSVDVSEDRRHSFSEADEAVLRALPAPLRIEIHLGAEDPRLTDFRREILDRLERVVPGLQVSYVGAGGTGLFAKPDSHYGEIWYEIAGKRVMLRSAIEQLVLQAIYDLAGIKAAPSAESEKFSGYPLKSSAPFAWIVFFVAIPVIILTVFVKLSRR